MILKVRCDSPADCTGADPCASCAKQASKRHHYDRTLLNIGDGNYVSIHHRAPLNDLQRADLEALAGRMIDLSINTYVHLIQIGPLSNLKP